jgi:hypothetical protein
MQRPRIGSSWWRRIGVAVILVFVGLQLVPYGWWHKNPPVEQDASWPDAESRSIAATSCYDCHSNETDWRVYAYVAPVSWLVRRDVEDGRDKLNFSEWDDGEETDKAVDVVEDGSMPPWQYTLVHPGARLSDEEKDRLIAALEAMGEDDDKDEDNSSQGG